MSNWLNPPFDAHMYNPPIIDGSGVFTLERGFILGNGPSDKGQNRDQISFLYNPSTISVAYGINGDPPPNTDTLVGPDLKPLSLAIGTLSFSLLFDRTYEMWNGNAYKDSRKTGVAADVDAFRTFVGVLGSQKQSVFPTKNDDGVMRIRFAYFVFGGLNSLVYYGFITDLNIQYTHWTQKMVPVRAVVGLSVMLTLEGAQAQDKGTTAPATPTKGGKSTLTPAQILAANSGKSGVGGR